MSANILPFRAYQILSEHTDCGAGWDLPVFTYSRLRPEERTAAHFIGDSLPREAFGPCDGLLDGDESKSGIRSWDIGKFGSNTAPEMTENAV